MAVSLRRRASPDVTSPAPAAAARANQVARPNEVKPVSAASQTPLLDVVDQHVARNSAPEAGSAEAAEEENKGIVLAGTMRKGTKGGDVARLQEFLGLEPDGKFGNGTREAVVAWQTERGLEPDGVVGPDTLEALAEGAKGVSLGRTMRTGARGRDVERLQRFLKLPVDGKFGPDTRTAVIQFQMDHGLEVDGIIGKATREALANGMPAREPEKNPHPPARPEVEEREEGRADDGKDAAPLAHEPRGELRSRWHDPDKFVPSYASTAYSESGIFRRESDPYAVGSISRPSRRQDLGGKSYGTFQLASYVYRNGSSRGKRAVDSSSLMRFVQSPDNPYSAELSEVVERHGVASAQFDALWTRLSTEQNKGFGEAQQAFVESSNRDQIGSFFDQMNASEEVRNDPRMQDLALGTRNQYASLAKGMARHAGRRNRDGSMSADELGRMIQDYKRARVRSHFRSSPGSHKGVYNRIAREKAMFD